jgi:uncharacterized protein
MRSCAGALARLSRRHPRALLAAGAFVALLSLPFAVRLYANLHSALEELLPESAPSIRALHTLHQRLGENMQLGLYLSGPPVAELHRLADALAARLAASPRAPRYIDYRPQETQRFFLARRALYVDLADLEELERRVDAHVRYAFRQTSLFDLGLEQPSPPPPIEGVLGRYRERIDELHLHESGYYDGPDGHSLAMVLYPAEGVIGYDQSLAFREGVRQQTDAVCRELRLEGVHQAFTGDVETVIQEQRSLKSDLLTSGVIVLVLEAVLLFFFFRWPPSLLAIGAPLAIGTLLTFAIAYGVVGSLNATTAFLGTIILGNGVNSGIILLARYLEERRSGKKPRTSMTTAVRKTALATFVAASAAAVAYGALMVTAFRGYSQFGFMGALGMWLCWLATYLWVPPLTLCLEAYSPIDPRRRERTEVDDGFAALGRFAVQHAPLVSTMSLVVSLGALAATGLVAHEPYENDTTKLRSRWASEPGGYLEVARHIDAILQRVLTPAVVLVARREDAEAVAEAYRQRAREIGPGTLLGSVLTLQALIPADQEAKVALLARLRHRLGPSTLSRLDGKTRRLIEEWLPASPSAFGEADLPAVVRRQFQERDGSLGKLVLVFPKFGTDTTDGRIVQRLAREVRSVTLPPGAVASGSYLIFADMFGAIAHDGPVATLLAFIAVALLSLLLARSTRGGLIVTVSLVAGVLWTAALASLGGIRLNFLNFIAFPITFGIGVDYATNVFARFRLGEPSHAGLVHAVSRSGAAVAACSGTTIIGYSALLFSRNGALFSFGMLAVLGELACLAAALVLLPAVLALQSPRQDRSRDNTPRRHAA